MEEILKKMTIDELHKLIHHVVGLMERAEGRAEEGHTNAFKYAPKYSVLLREKLGQLGQNKAELIELILVLYDDSYVRMLHKHEELLDPLVFQEETRFNMPYEVSSEGTVPSPISEVPTMSPKSPGLFNTFNLPAAKAAAAAAAAAAKFSAESVKRVKKEGGRRRTKRSRLKRRK